MSQRFGQHQGGGSSAVSRGHDQRARRRVVAAAAIALATGAGALIPGTAAIAAPSGGQIQIWVSGATQLTVPIVVTGAIADYGKATSEDKNGKPDINGNYEKVILKKGTFMLDA